jgi:hypothetical protein
MSDSVGLDEAVASSSINNEKLAKKKGVLRPLSSNLKIVIAIFLSFILVVSDVFTSSVVAGFRGAVHCRTPTTWGTMIQSVFLILLIILAVHLVDAGII